MTIISNTVNYLDGDVPLNGFFAYDDAITGQRPVVIISHAWAGRNEFVDNKAIELAKLGYLGFALDLYGEGKVGQDNEENARLMQPFMDDRTLLLRRLEAGLGAVKQMPWADNHRIAAIGYCFGGLCVLDFARSGADLRGVVSFHGLLNAPENYTPRPIKARVLMLHGHDDPMADAEQVHAIQQEFTKANVDWQLHSYGHTVHAFTNPLANDPGFGTVYNAVADQRSWIAMKNFLDEVFVK